MVHLNNALNVALVALGRGSLNACAGGYTEFPRTPSNSSRARRNAGGHQCVQRSFWTVEYVQEVSRVRAPRPGRQNMRWRSPSHTPLVESTTFYTICPGRIVMLRGNFFPAVSTTYCIEPWFVYLGHQGIFLHTH